MARMVPALPRQNLGEAERALVLAIEDQLEDHYVLFQPTAARGPVLVHPEEGIFVFVCVPGLSPAGSGWRDKEGREIEPQVLADAAAEAFHELAGPAATGCKGVVFAPGVPMAFAKPPLVSGMRPLPISESVLGATRALASSTPPGIAGIERLLQTLAPGTSPYVPDEITDSQRAWRAERADLEDRVAATALARPDGEPDRAFIKMIDAIVAETLQGKQPWLHGLMVRESEISSPRHLLGPLIVAAAENWAPIVASRRGRGGFHVRLRSDPASLLYYRVTDIVPSAPLLLFLPIVNLLRRSCDAEQCVLDGIVSTFRNWLVKNGLEGVDEEDIEVRIATSGE
jgi:hypothetical protein